MLNLCNGIIYGENNATVTLRSHMKKCFFAGRAGVRAGTVFKYKFFLNQQRKKNPIIHQWTYRKSLGSCLHREKRKIFLYVRVEQIRALQVLSDVRLTTPSRHEEEEFNTKYVIKRV